MPITIDDVVTEIDDGGGDGSAGGGADLGQAQLARLAAMAADLVLEDDDLVERIAHMVLQRLRDRAQGD